jgi:gamma-glutamyltranspeptidase/glutathione hydrolase
MSPTFIESKDQLAILGTPGGARIITMVLLSLVSWTEGADADEMTSKKRFHHQYLPDEVRYENGAFDNGVIESLKSKGHQLKEISDYGNMQVVTMKYSDGSVMASSDPRALIENIEILWY